MLETSEQKKEMSMFGCYKSDMDKGFKDWHFVPAVIQTCSILSDAQELIELGERDKARQFINRAKYLITTYLREKA